MATSRTKHKQPKSLHELAKATFQTPTGAMLLDELIRMFVHTRAFDKDPYQTAYLAGERGLVLLLDSLTHSPIMEDDVSSSEYNGDDE